MGFKSQNLNCKILLSLALDNCTNVFEVYNVTIKAMHTHGIICIM